MKNNIRIFIVEDSIFLQEMLCHIFTKEGMEVVGVSSSVEDAFLQIKTLKPDIALIDIILSQGDGTELISKIQKFDSQIKLLICSSLSQDNLKVRLPEIKELAFIKKPFGYNKIVDNVNSIVHNNLQIERVS